VTPIFAAHPARLLLDGAAPTWLVRSWGRRSDKKYPSQVAPPVFGGHVIFNTIQDLAQRGVTLSKA
jgi:hypothetical protein